MERHSRQEENNLFKKLVEESEMEFDYEVSTVKLEDSNDPSGGAYYLKNSNTDDKIYGKL